MGRGTHVPCKDNKRDANWLMLDEPSKPILRFSMNNPFFTQHRRAHPCQIASTPNCGHDLDRSIGNRSAHLLRRLLCKLIFLLFNDIECAKNDLLPLLQRCRLKKRSECCLGYFRNAFQLFGRHAGPGNDRCICGRRDGHNSLARHPCAVVWYPFAVNCQGSTRKETREDQVQLSYLSATNERVCMISSRASHDKG